MKMLSIVPVSFNPAWKAASRSRSIRPVLCALGLALICLCSPRLFAQTAGSISGHLSDPAGANLSQTDVTLTNVGTAASRVTKSTDAGDYTFTEVQPGFYTVQVKHAGFKTSQSDSFEVQIAQSVKLDLTLQVGEVSQSVEVQATGTLLQAENPTLGTVVETQEINELPVNGRNYLSLVALASNVNTQSQASGQAGSRLGGDRASQSIAIGGQRIMFDYYTLDGVLNTDPDFNTYVALPSMDGIQEMKVQTGVYSAEYGHEASQVNVVSKSGTNKFHGSAYEFIRNNYVDAQPYWIPDRHAAGTVQVINPFKYNDYGFELDGPIWIPKVYNGKDKFFFMVDDEWYRNRQDNPNATATVPTAAMAAGNFQGYYYEYENAGGAVQQALVQLYDPVTHAPLANNQLSNASNYNDPTVTANRQASQKLLAYLGTSPNLPYTPGASPIAPGTNPSYLPAAQAGFLCSRASANCSALPNYKYTSLGPDTNRQSLTVRGDYNMSQKSQFSFRYSSGNENILSIGLMKSGSKTITQYYQYMGSNTYTFSPTLVNEFRFGYSHFFNSLAPYLSFVTDVVDPLGIPGLTNPNPSEWGIPSMSLSSENIGGTEVNGLGIGTTPSPWSPFGDQGGDTPYVINDNPWQIVDNVTWIKGKHSLRLGFEYNRQYFNSYGNQFLRGQFTSEPQATALFNGTTYVGGDALADFLTGNIQSSTVALAPAYADYNRNMEAAYVDDTFKISPKVTISAGLRYELTPPWTDTLGNLFNTIIPVMPTVGTVNASTAGGSSIALSQQPYPVRQGNCTPANVYAGLPFVWTTNGPSPTCNNGMLPNGPMMDTHYLNFAPRFGVSYSPTEKTVIRAGYGIFYTQDIGNAYFDMARNIAGRVGYTNANFTTPGSASNLTWNNVSPFSTAGTVSILPLATVWYANAVSHHTSYTEQMLLNVQQQIGRNWSFEIGYQGALSRHLYGFLNANQVTPYGYLGTPLGYSATGAKTTICSRTPFNCTGTGSNQGIQFVHDEGTGNYHSGTFKVNRRFSKGVDLTASYTYAKSLDDTSGIRSQGGDQLYPQNSFCIPCEYGPSAFDIRNRIVVSGLYELPIGPGKLVPVNNKLVDVLIGGWQVGGTLSHQTGGVSSPQYGADNSGINSPFGGFDRPNATGISPFESCNTHTIDNCANIAAYSKPGVIVNGVNIGGLFGNAQRGSFHGPGYTNLDASLHKDFAMPYSEKHKLAIRFEVFNALNHPNWGIPNVNVGSFTSATFGQIGGAGSMRILQLAAKYEF